MTNKSHPGHRNVKITFVAEVVITGVPNYMSDKMVTWSGFEDELNWKDKKFRIKLKEILSREEIK